MADVETCTSCRSRSNTPAGGYKPGNPLKNSRSQRGRSRRPSGRAVEAITHTRRALVGQAPTARTAGGQNSTGSSSQSPIASRRHTQGEQATTITGFPQHLLADAITHAGG